MRVPYNRNTLRRAALGDTGALIADLRRTFHPLNVKAPEPHDAGVEPKQAAEPHEWAALLGGLSDAYRVLAEQLASPATYPAMAEGLGTPLGTLHSRLARFRGEQPDAYASILAWRREALESRQAANRRQRSARSAAFLARRARERR